MRGQPMRNKFFFAQVRRRRLIPLAACAGLLFFAVCNSLLAQTTTTEESIVITGEELPSAYGAPPGFSRSRFSNTTQAYVLAPWAFFFGEIFFPFLCFAVDFVSSVARSTFKARSFSRICSSVGSGSRLTEQRANIIEVLLIRGGFLYRNIAPTSF